MMSKEQFEQLIEKLDTLIRITTASAFRDKTKEESILILSDLGFQPKEIAPMVGTTPAYVHKVKHEAKKEKEKGKKKKEEEKKAKVAKQPKRAVEKHDEQKTV